MHGAGETIDEVILGTMSFIGNNDDVAAVG